MQWENYSVQFTYVHRHRLKEFFLIGLDDINAIAKQACHLFCLVDIKKDMS